MPVIKSAIKRVKTSARSEALNKSHRNEMRSSVRAFEQALNNGSEDLENVFHKALGAVDHAKSKGLIKANKASREKSRLTREYNNK